jgi:tRNA(fMet)-specific endonuclease VapC
MVKILLDTNAIAEAVRPAPNAGFLKRLRENETKLAIASVTLHEALYGVERLPDGKRKQMLRAYLRDVVAKMPVLPYDAPVAEWHARERVRLEAAGRPMPYADGQIAATAVVHGLTLVTSDARDFRHVQGLRVEDWRTAVHPTR